MSSISSVTAGFNTPPASTPSTNPSSSVAAEPTPFQQDVVELSLAGRIALNVRDGHLTSDQGQQLYSQLKTINQQIREGSPDTSQSQSQLSQQIYGDTHNGATIPADITVSRAAVRNTVEAGRIVGQENAGNLTSSQASQFFSQIWQIYGQSQNGASASATNQAQNQLSVEIYDAAHGTHTVPTRS